MNNQTKPPGTKDSVANVPPGAPLRRGGVFALEAARAVVFVLFGVPGESKVVAEAKGVDCKVYFRDYVGTMWDLMVDFGHF